MKWFALAALIAGFGAGYSWRDNSAATQVAALELAYIKALNNSVAETLAQQEKWQLAEKANGQIFADLKKLRSEKNRVVTKEVIKYVQSDNFKHSLNFDWVRIHDAAAKNDSVQNTAAPFNDSPSGVTDDQALIVITDNYQTCQDIRAQLTELQGWIRAHE